MDIIDIFREVTHTDICRNYSCEECRAAYGTSTCPSSPLVKPEQLLSFIASVSKKLNSRNRTLPVTEDELVDIIMEYEPL